jgi:hypothetical protein
LRQGPAKFIICALALKIGMEEQRLTGHRKPLKSMQADSGDRRLKGVWKENRSDSPRRRFGER